MPRYLTPLKTTLAALAVALAFLAFGAASASAKAPCWKVLLNDWFDGRIDNTYPVHCYREAVQNLPEDLKVYGEAKADINRALLSAIRTIQKHGQRVGPNTVIPAQKGAHPGHRKKDESFFARLVSAIGPSSASSIPLPLLILAGLGLLLLAVAGASFAARRIQARRGPPPDQPS